MFVFRNLDYKKMFVVLVSKKLLDFFFVNFIYSFAYMAFKFLENCVCLNLVKIRLVKINFIYIFFLS